MILGAVNVRNSSDTRRLVDRGAGIRMTAV